MSDAPLPLPAFTSWPTFPFEGELRVKPLADPVDIEPPRHGEDPAECTACRAPDSAYIWVSERWRVRALDRPTGLPAVLILESRSHLDMGDLTNLLAAELGVLTVRLERSIRSLDGVARVHVNRWGDGSAHLHVWFLARPSGRLQLRGTFLSLWDDILPRIPEQRWRENLAHIAAWLADFGGTALAEPPHIDWQSPAQLTIPQSAVAADEEAPAEEHDDTALLPGAADGVGPGRLEEATGVVADTVALPVGAGPNDGITTVAVPTQGGSPRSAAADSVDAGTGHSAGAAAEGTAGGHSADGAAGNGADGTVGHSADGAATDGAKAAGSRAVGTTAASSPAGGTTAARGMPSARGAALTKVARIGNTGEADERPGSGPSGSGETADPADTDGGATTRFPTTGGAASDVTTRFATTSGTGSSGETMLFPTGDAMSGTAESEGAPGAVAGDATDSTGQTVRLPNTGVGTKR